ncbi:hypothetical protein [Methylomonas rapida]|uniref:Uncharacterized protein n=1 Tax=Methylomonas rapida TaxID=2963939 RepID=A0ABY7GI89_9GAMM|nr:hypothetical protein [Methylomonas rapida]WAR43533.1 hypothetical protein NM686_014245 [Methylomonas rapida]
MAGKDYSTTCSGFSAKYGRAKKTRDILENSFARPPKSNHSPNAPLHSSFKMPTFSTESTPSGRSRFSKAAIELNPDFANDKATKLSFERLTDSVSNTLASFPLTTNNVEQQYFYFAKPDSIPNAVANRFE